MDEATLKCIMGQVKSFPGMPATAARLMPLLQSPDAGVDAIEDILRYDPGLTANLLKLTNSAYFGLPSRIRSVRQAVLLLGWKRVLQLVMTMCMSALMKQPIPGYDLPRGGLWRHSVAVSVAADLLIASLSITEVDEVFTAALLHDIGKIVLGNYVHEDLEKIKDLVAKGISFEVAEFVVLGMDHAAIGARILQNWSLPQELVNAVRWHHDPESCEAGCLLSDVVHVSNIVSRFGYGKSRSGPSAEPSFEVVERLGLTQSLINQLSEQTRLEMSKLEDVLN